MFKFVVLLFAVSTVYAYFTLPGNCPEKVIAQDDFKLHQVQSNLRNLYINGVLLK